jgi:hypothetical protein
VVVRGDPDFRRDLDHLVTAIPPSLRQSSAQAVSPIPVPPRVQAPSPNPDPPRDGPAAPPKRAVSGPWSGASRWRGRWWVIALEALGCLVIVAGLYFSQIFSLFLITFIGTVLDMAATTWAVLHAQRVGSAPWVWALTVAIAFQFFALFWPGSGYSVFVATLCAIVVVTFATINPAPKQMQR